MLKGNEAVDEAPAVAALQTASAAPTRTRTHRAPAGRAAHTRELWAALPRVTQALLMLTPVECALLLAYCSWLIKEASDYSSISDYGEGDDAYSIHYGGAYYVRVIGEAVWPLMISSVAYVYFLADAVLRESGAMMVVALALNIAGGVRLALLSADTIVGHHLWVVVPLLVLVPVNAVLGALSWAQFGWRTHSRFSADYRKRDAAARSRAFFARNTLRSLAKLDLLAWANLVTVGITFTVSVYLDGESYRELMAINLTGAVVGLASWAALWRAQTLPRQKLVLWRNVSWIGPVVLGMLWWPVMNIERTQEFGDPIINAATFAASTDTSMYFVCVLYMLTRVASAAAFHLVLRADQAVDHRLDSNKDGAGDMEGLDPALLPLVNGAWLVMQSRGSAAKRRFVQVSHDGRTLRWSWSRFLRLVYMEGLTCDAARRAITISTTADRDLTLTFASDRQYESWAAGLQLLLGTLLPLAASSGSELSTQDSAAMRRSLLKKLGFQVSTVAHVTSVRPAAEGGAGAKGGGGVACVEVTAFLDELRAHLASDLALQPLAISGTAQVVIPAGFAWLDFNSIKLGAILGAGAEGEVREGVVGGRTVAVKKFFSVHHCLREVQLHISTGRHVNVVELQGLCQHAGCPYLVMEYCPKGNLGSLLGAMDSDPWDVAKLLAICASVAQGVAYLHARQPPILHRDLKPGNIFVTFNQVMKIGDFGMARFVEPEALPGGAAAVRPLTPHALGTAHYAAPELYNHEVFDGLVEDNLRLLKIDIFALGVSIWHCMARKPPHGGAGLQQIQFLLAVQPDKLRLARVSAPASLKPAERQAWAGLASLAERCTRVTPDERPTADAALVELRTLRASLDASLPPSLDPSGAAAHGDSAV